MLAARRARPSPYLSFRTPLWRVFKRMFSSLAGVPRLRTKFPTSSSPPPEIIPADVLVDEEIVPGYDSKAFYLAHPGELLDGRYELKTKVGWGSSPTVWLAEDITSPDVPCNTATSETKFILGGGGASRENTRSSR